MGVRRFLTGPLTPDLSSSGTDYILDLSITDLNDLADFDWADIGFNFADAADGASDWLFTLMDASGF
jgi:hypothetical protein